VSAAKSIEAICQKGLGSSKPLLFLEDDVTSWNPNRTFLVPDDCDILRIGITKYHIEENSRHEQADFEADVVPVSSEIVRAHGMLCTHAIVFVTERAKRAFLQCAQNVINGVFEQYDTELGAFLSRSLNQYALKWPSFY
jgi:hypothetical protein